MGSHLGDSWHLHLPIFPKCSACSAGKRKEEKGTSFLFKDNSWKLHITFPPTSYCPRSHLALREAGNCSFLLSSHVPSHTVGVLTVSATTANTKCLVCVMDMKHPLSTRKTSTVTSKRDLVFVLNLLWS